ncbi:MAG: FAD-dependent oxidoreductase, partial [Opitutaceae bacterium]|nr:FAD-dependent oxidoreductase [Opitutaceae bacterium]
MLIEAPVSGTRPLRHLTHDADLAVIGGGLSGVCASIAAARRGLRVTLVQDRPVLGGNGSSEIRLWSLGATSHMGNNNRWAREGGLVDEIFVENLHRNREGNPHLFDTLLLEKVLAEPNITLLLDTALHDCAKSAPDRIASAEAFCPQTATRHTLNAPLFLDATGDGTLAWLAGAAARSGEEARSEFDEPLAPETPTRKTLGHSLFFYTTQAPPPGRY